MAMGRVVFAAATALLFGACSLLFSTGTGEAPEPELHYALNQYPDGYMSSVPNTGVEGPDPLFFIQHPTSLFDSGYLRCVSGGKCAQTQDTKFFASSIANREFSILLVLNNTTPTGPVPSEGMPHREIVRITEAASTANILQLGINYQEEGFGYQVRLNNSDDALMFFFTSEPETPSAPHHVALVLEGREVKLYVNGQPFVPDRDLPPLDDRGRQWRLKLGSDRGAEREWDGEVWELDFYRRALAQDEVRAAMAASLDRLQGS